MDLLAGVASHEGRRGGGDGSPSLASLQEKEAAHRKKKAARRGKRIIVREDLYRGKLPRRGEYGHDKESKILEISKLPSHCAYAKMSSLVHQMPSLPKCISQMQNCWRAIFKIFGKFQECKVQTCMCCNGNYYITIYMFSHFIKFKSYYLLCDDINEINIFARRCLRKVFW